jgi:DNA-binding IclR family transcriptional regulator
VPRSLESRLEEIRSLGVSIGSEVTAGIRAVAAPVFRGDEIVASVAVVGTAVSIPDDPDSHVVTMLRAAAKQISEELGATNGSANEEI